MGNVKKQKFGRPNGGIPLSPIRKILNFGDLTFIFFYSRQCCIISRIFMNFWEQHLTGIPQIALYGRLKQS